MCQITIPQTDLSSSPLAFGAANLGIVGSEQDGKALIDHYIEQGGTHIDTARAYSNWIPGEMYRSERILGDWLAERKNRDKILISSKGGHNLNLPDQKISRLSPEQIEGDLNGSLKTLRIDTIDLYWLHRDDPTLPVGPMIESLHKAQTAGKIRFYAASNWSASRIQEANDYAKKQGYTGFVASQVNWSLGTRYLPPHPDPTRLNFSLEHMALHKNTGLAALPYSSQASGYFSLRSRNTKLVKDSPYDTPGNQKIHDVLTSIIGDLGLSMTQAALAYLWSHDFPVIPLIGCETPEELKDTMSAVGCRLPAEVMKPLRDAMKD